MKKISATLLSIAIVGTRGASQAPSSEAPSTESQSLNSLSPVYPEASHSYIVSRLNSVFGEENCSITTQEEDPSGFDFLDAMNTRRMVCYTVESPCFWGLAEYYWYAEEPEQPKYLAVSYGYPGVSGITDIDFSDDGCGMECVEPYLRSISLNTLDGVPITTTCSDGPSPQPVPTPTIASAASEGSNIPQPVPTSTIASAASEALVLEPVNPKAQSANAQQVGFVVSNIRRPKRVSPYLP